jgi:hypothetical protein
MFAHKTCCVGCTGVPTLGLSCPCSFGVWFALNPELSTDAQLKRSRSDSHSGDESSLAPLVHKLGKVEAAAARTRSRMVPTFVGLFCAVLFCSCLALMLNAITAPIEHAPTSDRTTMSLFSVAASTSSFDVDAAWEAVIVTAASSAYFERVQNFVGSFHVWAPGTPVLVWDMGFTPEQRDLIRTWRNVRTEYYRFDDHAPELGVRNLYSFSWKILLSNTSFQLLPNTRTIVVLDAGLEIRSPTALSTILHRVERDGYC